MTALTQTANDPSRPPPSTPSSDLVRVLLVVEGVNDIEFLRRISRTLHVHDPALPDLAALEERGELVFVPFGGGDVKAWSHRLAPLGKPEFHLIDHELPPETEHRQAAAELVNGRNRCRAVLTRKRSIENYLHPEAIAAAGEVGIAFDDFDCVPEVVAKQTYMRRLEKTPWELLSRRARHRMGNRAKRWLNTTVTEQMTIAMIAERDPEGEILSWLRTIARMMAAG